jgi:hypothetical protein
MFKSFSKLTAIITILTMSGCVSYNVTGPIGEPTQPATITSPRTAQIADVKVSVPDMDAATRTSISRSLTTQIKQYVDKGGYFKQITEYPTRLGENDVVLNFNMTSLKGRRTPHPAYFPGALLTLTLWIWVNGPIDVDSFDLAGDLQIVDRDGKTLATSREQVKFERNVGIYGREHWAPTMGAKQLSELVSTLLDTATARLAKQ